MYMKVYYHTNSFSSLFDVIHPQLQLVPPADNVFDSFIPIARGLCPSVEKQVCVRSRVYMQLSTYIQPWGASLAP